MPNYNYGQFLPDAIKSVQNQTCKDHELVIYDDRSEDNSLEVLQSFGRDDPRINIIAGKDRRGAAHGYNAALAGARGEYCYVMDADDIIASELLQKSINFLVTHPDTTMVSSVHTRFSDKTSTGQILNSKVIKKAASHDVITARLMHGSHFSNSFMTRRDFFSTTGLSYDKTFPHTFDYNLFINALLHDKYPARFAIMDYSGVYYRRHNTNISIAIDPEIHNEDKIKIADNTSKKLYAGNKNYEILRDMLRCSMRARFIKQSGFLNLKNLVLWRNETIEGLCRYHTLDRAILRRYLNYRMLRIAMKNINILPKN